MRFCIDAGHNYAKYDTGAEGNGLREQDITFGIAEILKKLLVSAGHEVVMTRDAITDILGISDNSSINARVKMCNQNNCDYLISIHCNSHTSIASGTEVLVYGRGGQAEKLAEKVLKEIVTDLGTINRGVKEKNVGVLRDTRCPAILVETAFINNPEEAKLLKNNQYEFAYAIYKGVCKYLGEPTKESEEEYGMLNEITVADAKEILKNKVGLADETITFLECYKYGEDLIKKIAKAVNQ